MDLVEIRKKAKSRKKRDETKVVKTRGKEKSEKSATKADPSLEEKEVQDISTEAVAGSEELKVEEDTTPGDKQETNGHPVEEPADDSFSSLTSVLMSQREEEEEEEEEQLQLLTFMLGQEEYALNIMDIKEIIRPKEVTEVPKAPDYILGILSLRGTIIPVLDVNKRLGLPIQEHGQQCRIVVVKWQEHLFGLLVDSVVQVMNIPLTKVEPPPEILGGVEGEFLRGVGKLDERLIILLNLSRILAVEEDEPSEQLELPPETGR